MNKYLITKKILFLTGLTMYLIEKIEEIENHNKIYTGKLKRTAKMFLAELEKPLNVIYEGATDEAVQQGYDVNNEIHYVMEKKYDEYSDLMDKEKEEHEK